MDLKMQDYEYCTRKFYILIKMKNAILPQTDGINTQINNYIKLSLTYKNLNEQEKNYISNLSYTIIRDTPKEHKENVKDVLDIFSPSNIIDNYPEFGL